jgi:hypothetical protein
MPSLDFNDMYYFAQVVEHGGFAPAERALGIPKSKLSRRIALLEERLGVKLVLTYSTRIEVSSLNASPPRSFQLLFGLYAYLRLAYRVVRSPGVALHFYSVNSAMMGIAALNTILQRVFHLPLLAANSYGVLRRAAICQMTWRP